MFGIASGYWWFSYHLFFVSVGTQKKMGSQTGLAAALGLLSAMVAPLVGAWALTLGGELLFFGLAFVSIGFSLFAVLMFERRGKMSRVNWDLMNSWFDWRRGDALAYIGASGESILYALAWPIVLYLVFKDVLLLAGFSSFVVFLAAVFDYFAGKWLDGKNKEKMEHFGSWAVAGAWLGKAMMFNFPIGLSIFEVIHKLLVGMRDLPLQVIAYQHAQEDRVSYIAFREICFRIGTIGALSLFLVLVWLSIPLWFVFCVAAGLAGLGAAVRM